MQENYFTGEFKTDKTNQDTAAPSENQSQKCQVKQVQQQINKMSLNKQKDQQTQQNHEDHKQEQKQQVDEFVDAKEIIVQNQQIDEQKFLESNPKLAAQQKQSGNQNYSLGQYSDALVNYRKSLQYTDSKTQEDIKFRSIIYSNIGLTYMKMLQQQSAIEYFQKSLKLVLFVIIKNQKYTKARTNLAQCYENTQKLQQALQEYKKVLQLNPNDNYVRQKIIPLEIKVKDLQEKRKQEVMSGLKNIGNSILGYFGMSLDNFKLQQGPGGGYNISFKQ